MDVSQEILSSITVFMKYARYLPKEYRRENWEELVDRNKNMHIKKFPELKEQIENAYRFVYDKKVLPSMRSMQFAGKPVEINNTRIFNCAYLPVDNWVAFSEIMFLLLGGTGVGFSVQRHHVEQLPEIIKPNPKQTKRYLVGDSIEGWADSVRALMKSYFRGGPKIEFDFSDIRPKGALLITSGGKAPGPGPLKECLIKIENILDAKQNGDKLSSIEIHDIVCFIADAVLAGGIRRAALISLFSADDEEMLSCKSGDWYELNPQRGRANNSAVLLRHKITRKFFMGLWEKVEFSNAGEPGILFTNDKNLGTNPCKPLYSKILTPTGYITFEQARKLSSLEVVLPNGKIARASLPFKTGENKKIMKFDLSNGSSIYGTENHLHQTENGEWKRLDEFSIGDHMKFSNPNIHKDFLVENNKEYEDGMLSGWIIGDGWFFKQKDDKKVAGMCFGVNELDVVALFEKTFEIKTKPHYQKPNTCRVFTTKKHEFIDILEKIGISYEDKLNIEWLRQKSKSFKIGFLRALFTADGSARRQNNCELYSVNKKMLEVVFDVLNEFGIHSTICLHNNERYYLGKDGKQRNNKASYKINVYAGQFKRIGFLSEFKNGLLEKQEAKPIYRHEDNVRITNIEEEFSYEDVYDIEVYDESHSFLDNGIVSHNCVEISLKPNQFCNLCEINVSNIESQEDLNARASAAAFIGTLQASYTNFHYLRPIWKKTTEKEALLGIGATGIASGVFATLDTEQAVRIVLEENERVAKLIGINKAARTTCVKPSGTTSLVLGTSSGIHAWYADFYIRRIRVGKNESIYPYLKENHPELLEDDFFRPNEMACICLPQKAPTGAINRNEEVIDFLERVKLVSQKWVLPGHRTGDNTHNVSATISIKPDEWDKVGKWMWDNREFYNGLSCLPMDTGTYKQTPFEEITEEQYNKLIHSLKAINLDNVFENHDDTNLQGEIACAGPNGCEIK